MLDRTLNVKVDGEDLDTFVEKCEEELRQPYQHFIREIIEAFNQGRLRIIPTDEQKQKLGELYEH